MNQSLFSNWREFGPSSGLLSNPSLLVPPHLTSHLFLNYTSPIHWNHWNGSTPEWNDPGTERHRNGTTPERNDPGTERPRNRTTPKRSDPKRSDPKGSDPKGNDPEIIKINSQSLEDATTFHQKSGYHSGLFLVCYKTSNGLLKMSNNKMLNVCITIKYGLQILKCWNVFDIIFSLCYY